MVISITNAEYLGEYRIRLRFSDNVERVIDLGPFLTRSLNPMTRKYLDRKEFENFSIDHGDLVWNDHEMCFPIWDLHEGRV